MMYRWVKWLIWIILAFMVYYSLMLMVAPGRGMNGPGLNDTALTEQQPDLPVCFEEHDTLCREEAWLKAMLSVVKDDSISLVLDLQDTMLHLFLKGIMIHSVKYSSIEGEEFINGMDPDARFSFFSKPMTITGQRATVVKEPVVVKKAPKDTTEAAAAATAPDTLKPVPAFALLETNSGAGIVLLQDEDHIPGSHGVRNRFLRGLSFEQHKHDLSSVLRFRVPDYLPQIRITIPNKDVITIYRALPSQPKLIVRL